MGHVTSVLRPQLKIIQVLISSKCWKCHAKRGFWTRWFKVPFSSPSWRSLNPLKGSLNHPKKVTTWITRNAIFFRHLERLLNEGGRGGLFILKRLDWPMIDPAKVLEGKSKLPREKGGRVWDQRCGRQGGFFLFYKKKPYITSLDLMGKMTFMYIYLIFFSVIGVFFERCFRVGTALESKPRPKEFEKTNDASIRIIRWIIGTSHPSSKNSRKLRGKNCAKHQLQGGEQICQIILSATAFHDHIFQMGWWKTTN